MKLLITGALGQVGSALSLEAHALGLDVIGLGRPDLDICDPDAIKHAVENHAPDLIINAAAWTAVDDAEASEAAATSINAVGPANLAMICADLGLPLVHVSTDYVFDGTSARPYTETDPTCPINAYGRSKLAGEIAVRDGVDRHLILRTSWVYSTTGQNFVKTILRHAHQKEELRVVDDQCGKPTSAAALARYALAAIRGSEDNWGTYHVAQPAAVSWHGFAEAIVDSARRQGADLAVRQIVPVDTAAFPTKATRPRNSELDCRKFENTFELRIDEWHDALDSVVGELIHGGFLA